MSVDFAIFLHISRYSLYPLFGVYCWGHIVLCFSVALGDLGLGPKAVGLAQVGLLPPLWGLGHRTVDFVALVLALGAWIDVWNRDCGWG